MLMWRAPEVPAENPMEHANALSAWAAGLLYAAVVIRRARRQTEYKPVREDWIWYATLPCVAYATLGVTAIWLRRYPDTVLSAASDGGRAGHD
jgi:hypothetical protein